MLKTNEARSRRNAGDGSVWKPMGLHDCLDKLAAADKFVIEGLRLFITGLRHGQNTAF
jgi:hypothetical protein